MSLRCPNCKNKLLQKAEDGSVRLRTEGIHTFKADGTCEATCHWCKALVKLPIQLKPDTQLGGIPLTVRTT